VAIVAKYPVLATASLTVFAVGNYWQAIGVGTDPVVIPAQRSTDREYRATFPAFSLQAQPNGADSLWRHTSAEARLPSSNFSGNNYNRYMNPELDSFIDRYLTTIPHEPRMQALGDAMHHMTDQLTMMGLYYRLLPILVNNKVLNVRPREEDTSQAWNAEAWDLR
jgi:ABC-type transport system substrate-binding protein